jgi:hypothetical protein
LKESNELIRISVRIVLIVLLLIGIGKLPYGYYEFLHIFVSFVCVYLFVTEIKKVKKVGIEYLYGGMIVLFNPLIPFELTKAGWMFFDAVSAIALVITIYYNLERRDFK